MKRRYWFVLDIAAFLLIWALLSAAVPTASAVLPSPVAVAKKAIDMTLSGALEADIAASVGRTLLGFLLALVTALPAGLVLGWMPRVGQIFEPLIEVLRPISPIAWIPVSILWFGIGEGSKLFIIWQIAFFFILLNTISGVRSTNKTLVEAARTLGAGPVRILAQVILPAALPQIFVGIRLGLSVSLGGVILAEMIAAQRGLGVLIERSRVTLSPEPMLVGILAIGIIGYLANRLMLLAQARLTDYRNPRHGH